MEGEVMSIILKGIDKSKYARTFRIYPSGVAMEIKDGKIDNENPYEAIQIPKGHGDIKDMDTVNTWGWERPCEQSLENAPTILEAEE